MKNLTTKLFAIASVFCALIFTSCMDLYDGYETALIGTLTLVGNGGTTSTGASSYSRTFEKGKEIITLDNIFVNSPSDNQVFSGWAETPSASEPKYGSGAKAIFKYDTTLYAVWRTTGLFVSNTGNDNNDGLTEGSALASLQQAIKRINDKQDNNAVWKVTILNEVTGNTNIESIIAAKVVITGKKSDGTVSGILKGDGTSSVITISGSGSATLEFDNITIKNGYASVTGDAWKDSTVTGGGINIQNTAAKVTLNSGTIVTQNSAAFGGGVYNKGILVINGATISSNYAKGLNTIGLENGYGGGIYNDNAKLTFEGTDYSIASNNANKSGGGLYNYPDIGTDKVTPSITDLASNNTNFTSNTVNKLDYGTTHP